MNAETITRQTADKLGFEHVLNHEPTFWLRARLISMTTAPKTCGHTYLMFAALWSDTLACAVCAPSFRAQGEDDFRCDRCGVVEHPITVCAVVWRGLFVSFGLCRACAAAEHGERVR